MSVDSDLEILYYVLEPTGGSEVGRTPSGHSQSEQTPVSVSGPYPSVLRIDRSGILFV